MLPAGARTQLFSECAPFVRKQRVRGPSDVAGRFRNACRSCPGGSLRAIRPRFGIPDNTRRRTHAAHVLHGKNGLSGFWRKNFRNPDLPETDYLVGISPCDGSFRAGPPDRFQGVVDLYPCPGRRDGPDEAFRAVCRWGRIVALWMPETLAHGFSGGKTQPFGA